MKITLEFASKSTNIVSEIELDNIDLLNSIKKCPKLFRLLNSLKYVAEQEDIKVFSVNYDLGLDTISIEGLFDSDYFYDFTLVNPNKLKSSVIDDMKKSQGVLILFHEGNCTSLKQVLPDYEPSECGVYIDLNPLTDREDTPNDPKIRCSIHSINQHSPMKSRKFVDK